MELYKIVCVKLLKAANTIEFKQALSFNKKNVNQSYNEISLHNS